MTYFLVFNSVYQFFIYFVHLKVYNQIFLFGPLIINIINNIISIFGIKWFHSSIFMTSEFGHWIIRFKICTTSSINLGCFIIYWVKVMIWILDLWIISCLTILNIWILRYEFMFFKSFLRIFLFLDIFYKFLVGLSYLNVSFVVCLVFLKLIFFNFCLIIKQNGVKVSKLCCKCFISTC